MPKTVNKTINIMRFNGRSICAQKHPNPTKVKCPYTSVWLLVGWGKAERVSSAQGHVEAHHDDEADHGAPRRQRVRGQVGVRLGHDVVEHHEDHGAGGEAEREGQQRLAGVHGPGAQRRRQRLHRARQLAPGEGAPPAPAQRAQRQAHRQALGEVLDADACAKHSRWTVAKKPGNLCSISINNCALFRPKVNYSLSIDISSQIAYLMLYYL